MSLPYAPRPDGRAPDQLRDVSFRAGIAPAAAGSVLASFGRTQVICTAMFEPRVPPWMRQQGVPGGWLTAEYSMLPYSTEERKPRDIAKGKPDGRTVEIQRLIGRSLRAVVDLVKLGERTLWVDCDVLQADGGTRTAAVTGAWLAVRLALDRLLEAKILTEDPLREPVAAVSVGLWKEQVLLDLAYEEDRDAEVDFNVVMTGSGRFVEIQGTGEEATFSEEQFHMLLGLARVGISRLLEQQSAFLAARSLDRGQSKVVE